MFTIDRLNQLLLDPEGRQLEFKTARNTFREDSELPDYCAAISNEGGGYLILGVDQKTRSVVGTNVYKGTLEKRPHELLERLHIRVDAEEILHPKGRVIVFIIPPHPPGQAICSRARYLMRAGESLVDMDSQTLRRILNESEPDFSATIVPKITINDLDPDAIEVLKRLWIQKTNHREAMSFSTEKILRALELISDKGITHAALLLLGKKDIINTLLPGAEIIFEWRLVSGKIAYEFRKEWREPFLKIYDQIWEVINQRNLRIPFQEGFIQREIFAFTEKPIREAILNAVAHRDYINQRQSIFITASPETFIIRSPGGLVSPVTLDNILCTSSWRNRRIAEVFQKIGLVERSGQGMDEIFDTTIREGKGMPMFVGTDTHSVQLTIPANLQDSSFILFLEKVANKKQIVFSFEEIYELEQIRRQQKVTSPEYKNKFLKLGIIEQIGKTSGAKYILSHNYYEHIKKLGIYSRNKGISREQKKILILEHIEQNGKGYTREFADAFPDLKSKDINNMLQELKKEGKIIFTGRSKRIGYWVLEKAFIL